VENHKQGFIRAWHGHEKEAKYVYVASGAALVGAVNFETNEVEKVVLSSEKPGVLYIPQRHFNGFKNLVDNTVILFFSTSTLEESKGDDIRKPYNHWNIWQEDYR
jgi:dTDP-4-dehydrorhamnose 3,5-epimerase